VTEIMTNQNTVYSTYTLYIPCTDWTFLQYMFKSHTGKFYDCKTKTTLQHKSIGECRSVISYKLLAMTAHKLIKTLSKIRCSGRIAKVLVFKCDLNAPTVVIFHWKDLKEH